ncbi:hypothetical protein N9A94_01015 [Akkermansiaceae bacterium]|nr:hypothetical protein [Akkermansiaceae bacterium]
MKFKKLPILIALSLTALVSCKNDQSATNESSADQSAETKKIDSEYPLDTCVVSGKKLGSMGDPFVITHEGIEVRFCCDGCLPTFKKEPAKYLAKLKKP